jgi:hypothetical protein
MRVVSNISNAVFVIVSAIGFGTAMGACNLLKQKSVLENDLWSVSINNITVVWSSSNLQAMGM